MTDDNNKPNAKTQSIPSSVNPDAEPVNNMSQDTIELPDDRVTKRLIRSIVDNYPEFALTSHIGPDDNEYLMIQLANGNDLNHAAPGEFVSMVEGLEDQRDE